MATDNLRGLARNAVAAGILPAAHTSPLLVTAPADAVCALCRDPLGASQAFALPGRKGTAVLHAACFGAWVDIIIVKASE
jgi:hypothetical protein